jgi:hypothetical protein
MKGNERDSRSLSQKKSRVKYSDGIEVVENHKKWKEWINLERGVNKKIEYRGRVFKKDVPDHEEQLMTHIVNMMNYNQLPHEREKRDNNNNREIKK